MTDTPAHERMTAETLAAAAQKLRRLAFQADGGPWETTWRGQEYHLDGYRVGELTPISEWTYAIATMGPKVSEQRSECDTANADYMAAMHPGVGAALAELLETAAGYVVDDAVAHPTHLVRALVVARLILGEVA